MPPTDPTHARANVNLGVLLKDIRKDYDGAEWHWRAALRTGIVLWEGVAAKNGIHFVPWDVMEWCATLHAWM